MKKISTVLSALICAGLFFSCSSAPKRAMSITSTQESAAAQLEAANSYILTGSYDKAAVALDSAFKYAMSVDNSDKLTSICLAKVSLYLSDNPPYLDKAREYADMADSFADYSSNKEKYKALVSLYKVRICTEDPEDKTSVNELISVLEKNAPKVKGDAYNEAQFKSVAGDVYRKVKDFSSAEKSFKEAAEIYIKNRYLSEIGITWYKLAQVYSLNDKKADAYSAIEQAIFYDRSAENSTALGTDYYAKGLILLKGNCTAAQKEEAIYSLKHSADIFHSIGYEQAAQKSLSKLEEIK
ncbi:MAG: hypothetical protein MJ162_00240 [Treponema sp.]|nr:hypothetical protein [Treponema sp.]